MWRASKSGDAWNQLQVFESWSCCVLWMSVSALYGRKRRSRIKTVSFLLPGVTFEPKVSSNLIKSSWILNQVASNLPPCQAAQKSTGTESRRGLAGPFYILSQYAFCPAIVLKYALLSFACLKRFSFWVDVFSSNHWLFCAGSPGGLPVHSGGTESRGWLK